MSAHGGRRVLKNKKGEGPKPLPLRKWLQTKSDNKVADRLGAMAPEVTTTETAPTEAGVKRDSLTGRM